MRAAAVNALPEGCTHWKRSGKSRIHNRQRALARDKVDVGDAQEVTQFSGLNFHRARLVRFAGLGLWEGSGQCGVERQAAFDLLHRLMDVAVKNGDRAEA